MATIQDNSLIFQAQQLVCDKLNECQTFIDAGITFYPEDKLDIEYEVQNALAKQGLACVVMTPSLNYQGKCENTTAWDFNNLVLSIVENPQINRANASSMTALDIAYIAQEHLAGPNSETASMFAPVSIRQGEDGKLIVVTVELKALLHDVSDHPASNKVYILNPMFKTIFVEVCEPNESGSAYLVTHRYDELRTADFSVNDDGTISYFDKESGTKLYDLDEDGYFARRYYVFTRENLWNQFYTWPNQTIEYSGWERTLKSRPVIVLEGNPLTHKVNYAAVAQALFDVSEATQDVWKTRSMSFIYDKKSTEILAYQYLGVSGIRYMEFPNVEYIGFNCAGERTISRIPAGQTFAYGSHGTALEGSGCFVYKLPKLKTLNYDPVGVYPQQGSINGQLAVNYNNWYFNGSNPYYIDMGENDFVPNGTFSNCTTLRTLESDNIIKYVGASGFRSCSKLSAVNLSSTIINGDLSTSNQNSNYMFESCSQLPFPEDFTVRTNASPVGINMFYQCSKLKRIHLPDLTSLAGNNAFYNCYTLELLDAPKATLIQGSTVMNNCGRDANGLSLLLPNLETWNAATAPCYQTYMYVPELTSISQPIKHNTNTSYKHYCMNFSGRTLSTIPTLTNVTHLGLINTPKLVIPDALYTAWTQATNWATYYASHPEMFVKESEWDGTI